MCMQQWQSAVKVRGAPAAHRRARVRKEVHAGPHRRASGRACELRLWQSPGEGGGERRVHTRLAADEAAEREAPCRE